MKKLIASVLLLFMTIPFYGQVLNEVFNKPTSKKIISLNSSEKNEWTLFFGAQDESAPANSR